MCVGFLNLGKEYVHFGIFSSLRVRKKQKKYNYHLRTNIKHIVTNFNSFSFHRLRYVRVCFHTDKQKRSWLDYKTYCFNNEHYDLYKRALKSVDCS